MLSETHLPNRGSCLIWLLQVSLASPKSSPKERTSIFSLFKIASSRTLSSGEGRVRLMLPPPGFQALNCVQFCLPATFRCRVILSARYSAFLGNPACCLNQLIFVIQHPLQHCYTILQKPVWLHRGIFSTNPKRRVVQ